MASDGYNITAPGAAVASLPNSLGQEHAATILPFFVPDSTPAGEVGVAGPDDVVGAPDPRRPALSPRNLVHSPEK